MTLTSETKPRIAHALFSRTLHTYFLMRRGLTIGVRAIVRSDDGKFLLVRHTYTPGWHFPGGGVEKGETTEQALSNELRQETGLNLVGKPILHGVFHNKDVSKRDHVLAFLCDVDGSVEAKSTSVEIAEIKYFDLDDLPPATTPGTLRRIREVAFGAAKSESW